MSGRVEQIGNPRGRIALYLDEREAIDLAYIIGLSDAGAKELLDAVERAYPPPLDDEPTFGVEVVMVDTRRAEGRVSP